MKKSILMGALFTGFLAFGASVAVMAAVPPPPVNQFLGFYDTTFQFLNKADCLRAAPCHQSDAVAVTFHHALTLAPRLLSCYGDPTAPNPTGCHQLVRDTTGSMVFVEFRDCLRCHTTQPHHKSARAMAQDCQGCHGTVIDNPLDGHVIPTYAKSSVTPETKWRGNDSASPQNYGGCAACHQASATATPRIFSNAETHHATHIGFDTTVTGLPAKIGDCNWCHGAPNVLDMRACEKCHGIKSLHNIQVNSENPADTNPTSIVPGGELPGYGHIGSDFDCWGCHGTFKKYAADAGFQYTIPPASLNGMSTTSLISGNETTMTINGSGFKTAFAANKAEVVPVNVKVMVKGNNTSLTLTPFAVSDSEVKVIIPALVSGNYQISVSKDDGYNHIALSNVALINALPARSITTAALGAGSTVTVTGKGFNIAPPTSFGENTGIGAYAADGTQSSVISWSDTKIVVSNPAFRAGATVTVKTLNGPVDKVISAPAKKNRR